jgi:hypothetical protein
MRCPCCRGTGEVTGIENWYRSDCPECHGTGAVDTIRQWLRARRHLGKFAAMMLLLSSFIGSFLGILPALELDGLLDLLGHKSHRIGAWVISATLVTLGFFWYFWGSEDGPPRSGRGTVDEGAGKLVFEISFGFFLCAGVALAVVFGMHG